MKTLNFLCQKLNCNNLSLTTRIPHRANPSKKSNHHLKILLTPHQVPLKIKHHQKSLGTKIKCQPTSSDGKYYKYTHLTR